MSVESIGLNERAVLWTVLGRNRAGEATFNDPVEIACRQEKTRMATNQPKSSSNGTTLTIKVDREISEDSKLRLGKLKELPEDLDLTKVQNVVSYEEIPDIKGRDCERFITLV